MCVHVLTIGYRLGGSIHIVCVHVLTIGHRLGRVIIKYVYIYLLLGIDLGETSSRPTILAPAS